MILKYLPICLFAFSTASAQQSLTSQESPATFAFTEDAAAFVPKPVAAELLPEPAAVPYYSNGESAAHFYVNANLGFGNRTMATYSNVNTTGGGTRYGADAGVQLSLRCRHNGLNLLGIGLGYNAVYLKDRYGESGLPGATNNDFHFYCISMPIMLTTTYFGSRKANGVYLRAGATLDYAVKANANKQEWNNALNKFGFVPLFSFGWAVMYDYESRYTSGTRALTLGPFVSYNVMNMLNASNCSLRYMTFGIMYSGIQF